MLRNSATYLEDIRDAVLALIAEYDQENNHQESA